MSFIPKTEVTACLESSRYEELAEARAEARAEAHYAKAQDEENEDDE